MKLSLSHFLLPVQQPGLTQPQTCAGTTASVLGMPDVALITMNEMHDNARMLASLASADPDHTVPILADTDTGFGSPLNVARTTAAHTTSNITALHIEDQTQTKRCGHLSGKQLVSVEEYTPRTRVAALARQKTGRGIVIIAAQIVCGNWASTRRSSGSKWRSKQVLTWHESSLSTISTLFWTTGSPHAVLSASDATYGQSSDMIMPTPTPTLRPTAACSGMGNRRSLAYAFRR